MFIKKASDYINANQKHCQESGNSICLNEAIFGADYERLKPIIDQLTRKVVTGHVNALKHGLTPPQDFVINLGAFAESLAYQIESGYIHSEFNIKLTDRDCLKLYTFVASALSSVMTQDALREDKAPEKRPIGFRQGGNEYGRTSEENNN